MADLDTDKCRVEREQLQKAFPQLFDTISEVLRRRDPIGICDEANPDEYEPEVGTILPRLRTCESQSDVRHVVHEEFGHWFGEDIAGPESRYDAIASEIWTAWLQSPVRTA